MRDEMIKELDSDIVSGYTEEVWREVDQLRVCGCPAYLIGPLEG